MRALSIVAVTLLCAAIASPAGAQKDKDHGSQGKDRGSQGNDRGNQGRDQGNDRGNQGKADNRGGAGPHDGRGASESGQQGSGPQGQFVIVDRDRSAVSSHYRDEFARGNCPPGLAKKDNGCLPPGQAKKIWAVGQPLPPSVEYYPLPQPLYSRLTPPPYGYEYVRVYDDVLLMQTANRSIINIVTNLR